MSQRDLSYLLDVLSAARLAIQFTQTIDKETFNKDDLIQSGVMRQIEIMGEATKRLSQEMRDKYPEIPWQKIAGIETFSFMLIIMLTSMRYGMLCKSLSLNWFHS